ncbi:hypothetical protein SARC_09651 [Sphaeroforma arctica JP610]|uniref:Uncharacterized protein n=1 Tax=Sphaeroforma arctica JP610 TaxID=667725 RepID=A0A0L0FMA3_9EUKA|nr:hypothetical protein SARC_09651 [Sphaeroforma arctica JP610]KNC77902.1 hypothetical protein SARC_09651 [Sphaeroforma arctica JP610]|eukprot:XP_014151804.1 hypothetical protein SARC_09651 [Sphaeroforma arctica JP610]
MNKNCAPPAAADATEATATQVAPPLSKRKRKKLADSGVGASGGSVTTEPQKPPAKKNFDLGHPDQAQINIQEEGQRELI